MSAPYRRSLPDRPDLDQQKKLAKELLRAFQASDAEAVARIRAELPDKPHIALADAQFVIAREYGFASWSALKAGIEERATDRQPPLESWRNAVQSADAKEMRRLLEMHAEIRAQIDAPIFSFDSPALVHLAGRGRLDVIDVLLEFGADPNRRSDWWAGGFHALHGTRGPVAERLLAAGAMPDTCAAASLDRADLLEAMLTEEPGRMHERGGDGQTPLHFARSTTIAQMLLDAGADPDARDVDHHATPAQWMLDGRRDRGRYALAKWLVEHGASPDIFLAAALGLTERIQRMVSDDPSLLDLRTHQGDYGEKPPSSFHIYTWTIGQNLTPLQVAAQFDQTETLAVLQGMSSPRQHFVAACSRADADTARALLREHPRLVDELTAEDRTALPAAASASNAKAVELMLELGFDPATPGQDTGTVLHWAALEGAARCVAVVLRHPRGRELVSRPDSVHHSPPLGWCCFGSAGGRGRWGCDHAGVARMLLEAGAEPVDASGASPAVRAVVEGWRK